MVAVFSSITRRMLIVLQCWINPIQEIKHFIFPAIVFHGIVPCDAPFWVLFVNEL